MRRITYQPDTWPYKLRLLKRVGEMDWMPRGYRVFMKSVNTYSYIAAPFGLHWLFGAARYLWELLYRAMFSQLIADAIDQARWDGRMEGAERERQRADIHCTRVSHEQYLEGFNAGRDAMFQQLLANIADDRARIRGDA